MTVPYGSEYLCNFLGFSIFNLCDVDFLLLNHVKEALSIMDSIIRSGSVQLQLPDDPGDSGWWPEAPEWCSRARVPPSSSLTRPARGMDPSLPSSSETSGSHPPSLGSSSGACL